jgi:hypothetical protein
MVERFPMISTVCANVAACATNPAFRTNIVSDIATAPAAKPLCPRYAGPMAIQLFALADPGCTPVLRKQPYTRRRSRNLKMLCRSRLLTVASGAMATPGPASDRSMWRARSGGHWSVFGPDLAPIARALGSDLGDCRLFGCSCGINFKSIAGSVSSHPRSCPLLVCASNRVRIRLQCRGRLPCARWQRRGASSRSLSGVRRYC